MGDQNPIPSSRVQNYVITPATKLSLPIWNQYIDSIFSCRLTSPYLFYGCCTNFALSCLPYTTTLFICTQLFFHGIFVCDQKLGLSPIFIFTLKINSLGPFLISLFYQGLNKILSRSWMVDIS